MNEAPLRGQTALVTGAAKRIGAVIARQLHAAGANVVLHYGHSAQEAQKLVAQLNERRQASALTVQADLLDIERLPGLVEVAAQSFGGLNILINNASSFYPTPLGKISLAQWDDLFGTNLKAPLFLSQAAAAHLKRTQGLILNLADIHALRPLRRHTVYCMAKAGLIMLTRSLARELGPEVRVNAIAPGPVLWPEEDAAGKGVDEVLKEEIISRTALKKMGSPEDIARAALFFAADAPYVTGQVLAVDGGRSIAW